MWVGGLPASIATITDVAAVLSRAGQIESCHVRVKPGVNKNWALVLFCAAESAQSILGEKQRMATGGLSSTAGWKIKMVQPDKLMSMEAQFTIAGVELDSDPTQSIGGEAKAVGTRSTRAILTEAYTMVQEERQNRGHGAQTKGPSVRPWRALFAPSDQPQAFTATRESHSSRRARVQSLNERTAGPTPRRLELAELTAMDTDRHFHGATAAAGEEHGSSAAISEAPPQLTPPVGRLLLLNATTSELRRSAARRIRQGQPMPQLAFEVKATGARVQTPRLPRLSVANRVVAVGLASSCAPPLSSPRRTRREIALDKTVALSPQGASQWQAGGRDLTSGPAAPAFPRARELYHRTLYW